MRPGYAAQYAAGVVILEKKDFPIDEELVIETAWEYEAVTPNVEAPEEANLFVVRFPDRPDEAYTEDALRRSIRSLNAEAA